MLIAIGGLLLAGAACVGLTLVAIFSIDPKGTMPPTSGFAFDPAFAIPRRTADGVAYSVNNSPASFTLDLEEPDEHCRLVFKDHAAAAEYCRSRRLAFLPSVAMVQAKCKAIDDRLSAALETAVQRGLPGFPGKREILRQLLSRLCELRGIPGIHPEALPAFDEAIVHVGTALSLGGAPPKLDPALAGRIEKEKDAFTAGGHVQSRPIGFWTSSEELREVFRQDRYLMRGLRIADRLAPAIAISAALNQDPSLLEAVERLDEFDGKLTNRSVFVEVDRLAASEARLIPWRVLVKRVAPAGADRAAMLAAARPDAARRLAADLASEYGAEAGLALVSYATSREYGFLHSVFAKGRLRDAADTMTLIIDAVESGRLSLDPRPDSGWYDYQVHALETLLLPDRGPESAKLSFTEAYRERLRNAFAASLTLQRETHVKHLPEFSVGMSEPAPKVEIAPEFSVEPTATVYLRLARAYRFLRTAMGAVLGEDALRAAPTVGSGSPAGRSVAEEMEEASLLLYGLHETAGLEIGQRSVYLEGEMAAGQVERAKAAASAWLSSLESDPDLAADSRFAVPISGDAGHLFHWATGGVRLDRILARYDREPVVRGEVEAVIVPSRRYAPAEVFLEFAWSGSAPLTRDEFRTICDRAGDEDGLRRALGAPPRLSRRPWGFWPKAGAAVIAALAIVWGLRKLLPWARSCFAWRKLLIGGVTAAAAAILLFILALVVFPGFRVKFLVTQLAARNQNLAIFAENLTQEVAWRDAVPALAGLLDHPDPQVRYLASRYLWNGRVLGPDWEGRNGLLSDPRIMESLQRASRDPVPEVAMYATYVLGECRNPGNVDFLIARLEEGRSMDTLCVSAMHALSDIGDPRALNAVLPLSRDPRPVVRRSAIDSLGSYDDPRAEARIREALVSGEADSMSAATSAISSWYVRHRHWQDARFDDSSVLAAGRSDLSFWLGSMPALEEASLNDPDDRVRAVAREALEHLKNYEEEERERSAKVERGKKR